MTVAAPARAWRAVRWYVNGVLGEDAYDRYVTHLGRQHPDAQPPTRRDFERDRAERLARTPGSRCC